jgi:predicted MFS family arabinose efflux permease
MMAIMYLLVKGVLASTVGLIQLPYCKKTLKVDGTSCQTMGVIAHAPWAMKGTIGVLSDAYPLFGYHKNSYILLSAGLGTAAFLFLAIAPNQSIPGAALLLLLGTAEISIADLLCEGRYAALMKTKPESGNSMVSLVWGCCMVGGLVAAAFVGPVADAFDPSVLFWVCVPLAGSIVFPIALGYLSDPVRRGPSPLRVRSRPGPA